MSSSGPQNFYLTALGTSVTPGTVATFFPSVYPINFTDYSANAICRMKLSVAKNMFQFWASSAELSSNSLSDLVFRTMYDPSSGLSLVSDQSSNPMSVDFTLGSIVTWSDPTNINSYTTSQGTFQTLMPQDYLRFLAWVLFGNPNLTTNFLNGTAVESSFNSQAKLALSSTLAGITAYNYGNYLTNNLKQYTYNGYQVNIGTFIPNPQSTPVDFSSNPASQIFQQIRTNAKDRIEAMTPSAERIEYTYNNGSINGAWYKMPFKSGDSIYFVLTANLPQGQTGIPVGKGGTVRKYRVRMYIMDDTPDPTTKQSLLSSQTQDSGRYPINFGSFNVYPNTNSLINFGYSYADTTNSSNQIVDDPNDIAPTGLPNAAPPGMKDNIGTGPV